MWQFMFVTFAFLGFAFYHLSGGAEYEPAPNSLQARGAAQPDAASPHDAPVRVVAKTPEAKAAADTPLAGFDLEEMAREATRDLPSPPESGIAHAPVNGAGLESVGAEGASEATSVAAIDAAVRGTIGNTLNVVQSDDAVFSLETYVANASQEIMIPRPTAETPGQPAEQHDLREVTGEVANMRTGPGTDFAPVGVLTRGTQIAVLEEPGNGWIMMEVLDTGETGWMADWLVRASN